MMGITSPVKIRPDLLVLSFTLGISILTGIGFGLFPALRSIGMARSPGLGMSRFNSTHAFVVLQVALSSVLLVGAGLLTHSLFGLEHQDLGYSREHLLLIRTDPRLAGYQPAELFSLYRRIQDRLNALPGVVSACIARFSPLSGNNSSNGLSIEGYTPTAGKEMRVYGVEVGPRFFETLRAPLLLGRPISPRDTPASPAVAVVNESFVREYLPQQNPLGIHFALGSPFRGPGYEIVGVAADSNYYKIDEKAKPMAYFSAWQSGGEHAYVGELVIRTSGDPSGATAEVKGLLHEIDSRLPILRVTTLSAQVHDSLRQERMITTFCAFFGLLALLLAAIGLYGTMSYAVARRTKEIGVRMALGAQRPAVLWRVLRESVVLIGLGLIFGLPLALGATRGIKSFLFGISTTDPVGIGAAIVLVALVSTLAGYLPARRATKVDPMVALRHE
jgi:predicted permease